MKDDEMKKLKELLKHGSKASKVFSSLEIAQIAQESFRNL